MSFDTRPVYGKISTQTYEWDAGQMWYDAKRELEARGLVVGELDFAAPDSDELAEASTRVGVPVELADEETGEPYSEEALKEIAAQRLQEALPDKWVSGEAESFELDENHRGLQNLVGKYALTRHDVEAIPLTLMRIESVGDHIAGGAGLVGTEEHYLTRGAHLSPDQIAAVLPADSPALAKIKGINDRSRDRWRRLTNDLQYAEGGLGQAETKDGFSTHTPKGHVVLQELSLEFPIFETDLEPEETVTLTLYRVLRDDEQDGTQDDAFFQDFESAREYYAQLVSNCGGEIESPLEDAGEQ